ncbi:MAG: 5'-nucleotidase C-terminal domain-containing protein [Lachnospirales bacterium]
MKKATKLSRVCMAVALAATTTFAAFTSLAFADETTSKENAEGSKTITILGTSDLHSGIWGYSYEDNEETTNNGMARLYTYIKQTREENPNTFLIDAGDDIQGSIMTDDIYNKTPELEHPVISAMNYMGYDSMALGNHEFNWGIPTMKKILSQAEFPVLAANVKDEDGNLVTGKGWTIVERGGVKVAIIGTVTPDVPIWDGGKEGIDEATYEAGNTAVKAAIKEIRDKADIIVVSTHMGMYAEFDEENGSDSAQKILDDNPEIDVLHVAHNHVVVQEKQGDTVIGGVRNLGRDIARFDLTLDENNNIIDSTINVVDMTDVEPSEEIRSMDIVKEAHQKTIEFINGGGAEGEEEGGAVLGSTTDKFQPVDEITGIPSGRLMDTAVTDLINKIQLENSGADVSAVALFKNTSDLPEGELNYGDIFNIYKFDNTLYRVAVTGKELKNYMEWSAECYNQWQSGDINISFDPDYPGYLYDMFAGVDYQIDLSQTKGERIKNLTFKGEPLKDDQILTLAVNNYRYSSALKAGGLIEGTKDWESSNSIRDMIVEYFAENSPVTPSVDNNWEIIGVDLQIDNPERIAIIERINAGEVKVPYDKSINLNDSSTIIEVTEPYEMEISDSKRAKKEDKKKTDTEITENKSIMINGVEVAEYIETEEGIFVPLRKISDTLGLTLNWLKETKSSQITNGVFSSNITIGNKEYTINKSLKQFEYAPQIIDDLTYVPVSYVTDALALEYKIENGTLTIS